MGLIEEISEHHENKEYRPVVVLVIKNSESKYLIVQSVKGIKPWSFPQGGIENGELPEDALFREIEEEVGITSNHLTILYKNFFYKIVNAPSDRMDKRGFTKGKAYYFNYCEYSGPLTLVAQEDEINSYEWVEFNRLTELLKLGREEKLNMTLEAINILEELYNL
jgi:8-oxo-dGTP pyrophosphatase MutT (NUDIX family)